MVDDLSTNGVSVTDPTADVSAWLRERSRGNQLPLADRDASLPVSTAQQRLWFDHQLRTQVEGGTTIYHSTLMIRLREQIDTAALAAAADMLVMRHESLRTCFSLLPDGSLRQRVSGRTTAPLHTERHADAAARDAGLAAFFQRPFDLEAAPLVRFGLFTVSPTDHTLLVVAHHIVTDGWSMEILHHELGACYAAARAGRAPSLPVLTRQYVDYAVWEHARSQDPTFAERLRYWADLLAGVPPLLDLPTDRPRERVRSYECGVVRADIPATTVETMDAMALACGGSRFHVLLAAAAVLLSRWCGQPDLVIGTPSANRASVEVESMVGFFANLLPLLVRVREPASFADLVREVRSTVLDAHDNSSVTFDRIVDAVAPDRVPGANPLVQVAMTLADTGTRPPSTWGERLDFVDADKAQLDLTIAVSPGPATGLTAVFYYAADLFDRPSIERLAARLVDLLARLTGRPDEPMLGIATVTSAEERELARIGSSPPSPHLPPITELFARQVALRGAAPAVLDGGKVWTYRELDRVAGRVAALVRERTSTAPVAVAVCLPRSAVQIAAMLGVMRAGAIYLPVDPANPSERLRRILRDADCTLVLTDDRLRDSRDWSGVDVLDVASDPGPARSSAGAHPPAEPVLRPERPAYLIYTSGSTGRPKGVEVDHGSLSSVIQCYARHYDLTPDDRLSQTMNHSFDAGLLDTLPALITGGSVAVLPDEARLDPARIWRHLDDAGVTISFITTALFVAALESVPSRPGTLRMLQFGGELFTSVPDGLPFRLEHMYGPTEVSIWTSAGPLEPRGRVHIGRPVGGLRAHVLDRWLRPVPIGVPGELYLAGDRLAIGYRGAPSMTASRFVPDPWSATGRRMYRTGDRVRWLKDGTLEFLGRWDSQVKVRGFRIELGEVEAVLAEQSGVAEAIVVLRQTAAGQKDLWAYVRLHPSCTVEAVRAHAEDHLPPWMQPSSYTTVEKFPLTPNGKTDLAALPPPEPSSPRGYTPPEGPVEELLAEIWCELLGTTRVSRTDDFFKVGGHSLLATRLLAKIADATGCQLALRVLFDNPVLRDLACHLEDAIVAAAQAAEGAGDAHEPAGAGDAHEPQRHQKAFSIGSEPP